MAFGGGPDSGARVPVIGSAVGVFGLTVGVRLGGGGCVRLGGGGCVRLDGGRELPGTSQGGAGCSVQPFRVR